MATNRLTGKDIVIQWLTNGVVATHVQHLYFQADVAGGSFKLRVNGELTAAINLLTMPAASANTFVGDTVGNELDDVAHGLSVGDRVVFENTGGALPAPLAIDTLYYVVAVPSVDSFQVSTTSGGAPVTITTIGTGVSSWNEFVDNVLININAALDALPNLTAGDIVATGSAITDITLTGAADGFYRILFDTASNLLTGNTSADPDVVSEVTTQGADWVTLSADAFAFSFEESGENVDVTALSQSAREYLPVADGVTFSLSIYKATDQEFMRQLEKNAEGWLAVYETGKIVGKEYFVLPALIETVSTDVPDHAVIEHEVSGMRSGEWIVPPKSIYR